MASLSLGMPFGESLGLDLGNDRDTKTESAQDIDSKDISSISIFGASSQTTDSLLDHLQTAKGAAPAQQIGCKFKGLLLAGPPTCFLAKNLEPQAVVAGILVVDLDGYDRLSPNISLDDSGRTMFHDDIDYFRKHTSDSGAWHDVPLGLLLVNGTKVARRINLQQIRRLYPGKGDTFAAETLSSVSGEDRIRDVAGFFMNILLQATERKMSTYVAWTKSDNNPGSVVNWIKAMVKDVLARESSD